MLLLEARCRDKMAMGALCRQERLGVVGDGINTTEESTYSEKQRKTREK